MVNLRRTTTIVTALAVGVVLGRAGLAQEHAPASSHGDHSGAAQTAAHDLLGPSTNETGFSHDIDVAFELLDRDGNIVTQDDFLGRHVLLGFGFTHCAHICPMMALNMGKALRMTDLDATGIFVSVDTERDTPAITDDYASNFGENMIGLGGSYEQVSAAAANFKVSYAVTKTQDNYTVQHTANVFVIDPAGELLDVLTFASAPEELLGAMR